MTEKIIEDIINKCVYWYISRDQRIDELNRSLGLSGTSGYENMGCYRCLGVDSNKDCFEFLDDLVLTQETLVNLDLYEKKFSIKDYKINEELK